MVEYFGLPAARQFVGRLDHLFPSDKPSVVSVPSKISFSSVSCSIFTCSAVLLVAILALELFGLSVGNLCSMDAKLLSGP